MSYLRGLSDEHEITLVTHEKPEDRADSAAMMRAQADCARYGIRWRPQKFHRRPRLLAPALDMLRLFWLVWCEVRAGRAELIHARSYLTAGVALVVHRLTGVPFIFDMRALWPEEMITAGRLRRGSMLHRVLQRLERVCLRDAAAVVSLTNAAVAHLRDRYPHELAEQHIAVIPTCADLERFTPASDLPKTLVYGCIGTVMSGWFRLDWLAAFFRASARREPQAQFEVVTRDDADAVRTALDPKARFGERLSIFACPSERVDEAIRCQTASAMFYAGGAVSELGRSPTRMAEILGCGVPVIANEGVGDVANIIREYNVGVILTEGSEVAMMAALDELEALRSDPDLRKRCRQAAEDVFSLQAGTAAYRKLYTEILGCQDCTAAKLTMEKATDD
jgi:glycosyltransferase involved in cell wall biosynthesis